MSMTLSARVIQYEDEGLSFLDMIKLYQELVNDGLAYELQGDYTSQARYLLDLGLITDADTLDPEYTADPYRAD